MYNKCFLGYNYFILDTFYQDTLYYRIAQDGTVNTCVFLCAPSIHIMSR
jgi:hypothetical protein